MSKEKNPAKKQRKYIFIWSICLVIVVLLLFFWGFSHQKYVAILEPLRKELSSPEFPVHPSPIQPDEAVWINNYTDLSILTGNSFHGVGFLFPGLNVSIAQAVTSYFTSKGFQVDKTNTFSTLDTEEIYQVQSLGFTKGDTKCLVTIFVDSDPNGYYFCGKVDTKKDDLQKEFYPVLNGPNAQFPLRNNEASVINVKEINDSFATGYNNRYLNGVYEPSGTTWIAAKVNGQWQLVFDGQDYPLCSSVDKYNVPKEFYVNCFYPNNTFRFDLRN